MTNNRSTRGIDGEAANLAVPEVRSGKLPGVPAVHVQHHVSGSVEPGKTRHGQTRASGFAEETEALELTNRFANEVGVPIEESRPCVASLFYNGASSRAKPSGHIVALELAVLGFTTAEIKKNLEVFSDRCAKPLRTNDICSILRGVEKEIYSHRYGCSKLQAWCIDQSSCPWKKGTAVGLNLAQKSGPTAFVSLGWPGYLAAPAVSIFLALLGMRMQRRSPDQPFTFFFAQLELRSGISRNRIRPHLEALEKVGLIVDLAIGPAWGSGQRQRTTVRLAAPLPEPNSLGLSPLRSKDWD